MKVTVRIVRRSAFQRDERRNELKLEVDDVPCSRWGASAVELALVHRPARSLRPLGVLRALEALVQTQVVSDCVLSRRTRGKRKKNRKIRS